MNLTLWQTLFLAFLQGATELFPISSLGHMVILPALLGWGNLETNTACGGESCFLPILTALHLGTAIALLIYFWRDWLQVIRAFFKGVRTRKVQQGTEEWGSWLILIGCIPAGIVGVALQKPLQAIFSSPLIAAAFLVVNGSVLFLGEVMRRRSELKMVALSPKEREAYFRPLYSLTWREAIIVGLMQTLSLIPGFSRSGMSMAGGLMIRMRHEDAARFSFLLGTPLIFGAALIEVPKLFHEPSGAMLLVVVGMIVTGIVAWLCTKFLMRYFETGRLDPFAYYCWGAGLLSLVLLLVLQ